MTADYRALPSLDALLRHPMLQQQAEGPGRQRLVAAARRTLAEARQAIGQGDVAPAADTLAIRVHTLIAAEREPHVRPVINASGVILQTNLGRAPLSAAALAAVTAVAAGYSNLEFDLVRGERGSRQRGIGSLIATVTGAPAGLVVNNNAAAVLVALAALTAGKEVLVSRGQLVEIGGGFRIPDVLAQSGARLVEVGTTNRTYTADYAAAITPATAAILRVHPSNFIQHGFTYQPDLKDVVALSRARGILMIDDLGSGALLDTAAVGLAHEPMVQESVAAGVDIVCFSGDKLVGGPQAGLVAGMAEPLAVIARHPLARAVRLDKLGLAALEATLRHYLLDEAVAQIPVWQMLHRPPESLAAQASAWVGRLTASGIGAAVVVGESTIGGGALPGETLPTSLVALAPPNIEAFAQRLRTGYPAVVGRVHRGRLLLDPRTVLPPDEDVLLARVVSAWRET